MGIEVTGLLGLLILAFDIYAIIQIVSSKATVLAKTLWSLLIIFLPVIGLIIWFFAGPRGSA